MDFDVSVDVDSHLDALGAVPKRRIGVALGPVVKALVGGADEPPTKFGLASIEPAVDEGVEIGPDSIEPRMTLGLLQLIPGEDDDSELESFRLLQQPRQALGLL